jgi:redox-sensitive bicupin YhaK (pirin superfamily)
MRTTDATSPQRAVAGVATGQRHAQARFLVAGFRDAHPSMDPFLTIDHFAMDEPTFRPHPHAGFSAVTVLFEGSPGSFRNRDSRGADLTLRPGDIHWTRAGSGIQHEEVPTVPGIVCHGAQIFIALPPDSELDDPEVLHLDVADVPTVTTSSGARVRALAGDLDGQHGIDPGHDVTLLDVTVPAGTSISLDPGPTRTCFVLAVDGHGRVNGSSLDPDTAIGLDPGPGVVTIEAHDEPLHVLVGGGTPLRRPTHWVGGIAMSTRERSDHAADRHRRGEFGDLAPSF